MAILINVGTAASVLTRITQARRGPVCAKRPREPCWARAERVASPHRAPPPILARVGHARVAGSPRVLTENPAEVGRTPAAEVHPVRLARASVLTGVAAAER